MPATDAGWTEMSFVATLLTILEVSMESLFFHPKLVHLPIALGLLMPLVAGGLLLAWWRHWLPPRAWAVAAVLQAALVASGALALQSGEVEEEKVERVVHEQYIEDHAKAAAAFVWVGGGVLLLMVAALGLSRRRAGAPLAVIATLGTVAVLGLGYRTGQAGGQLVYRYGAASVYTQAAGAAGAPIGADEPVDDD
jgi:uncharacterized membrane protein